MSDLMEVHDFEMQFEDKYIQILLQTAILSRDLWAPARTAKIYGLLSWNSRLSDPDVSHLLALMLSLKRGLKLSCAESNVMLFTIRTLSVVYSANPMM